MVKKLLLVCVLSIFVQRINAQFLYATCSGYAGDFPLVGHFSGSYSTQQPIPFSNFVGPIMSTTDVMYGPLNLKVGNKNVVRNDSGTFIKTPGLYYSGMNTFVVYDSNVDTVKILDTVLVNKFVTLIKYDTIKVKSPIRDTFYITNYTKVIQKDTIQIRSVEIDTVVKFDTIKIHDTLRTTKIDTVVDTLQLCNVVNRKYTEEIYPKHILSKVADQEGLSAWISKDGETYKNVNDNRARSNKDFLNYVSVRIKSNFVGKYKVYAYDNSSVFVNDIEVKVSDEYSDYTLMITFNGKSKFGTVVSDGVYLLRVISQQENSFGNNVYKIGVKLK